MFILPRSYDGGSVWRSAAVPDWWLEKQPPRPRDRPAVGLVGPETSSCREEQFPSQRPARGVFSPTFTALDFVLALTRKQEGEEVPGSVSSEASSTPKPLLSFSALLLYELLSRACV